MREKQHKIEFVKFDEAKHTPKDDYDPREYCFDEDLSIRYELQEEDKEFTRYLSRYKRSLKKPQKLAEKEYESLFQEYKQLQEQIIKMLANKGSDFMVIGV